MAGLQVAWSARPPSSPGQHFNTFKERFRRLPDRDRASFPPGRRGEAKATKEGISAGQIDVVIGTHAILAKGVQFKNLGLVIVDESKGSA
jgi:transcription-repair coupling factor (superfamily II helicase)